MAIYVKPVPTLTGKAAERFYEKAAEAENRRASVDFTRQVKITHAILEKSKKFQ